MVRKKGMGKNIATSSRQEIVKESEDDFMVEDSDEDSVPLESRTGKREKRRKRRTPKKMEVDAKLDWVESIPNKGFKSEANQQEEFWQQQQYHHPTRNQGLLFWTKALYGYNVIEFYQKLDISDVLTSGKIKSKVNGKTIVVDVPAIAKYLRYERREGDLVNYPRAEPIESDIVISDLYPHRS